MIWFFLILSVALNGFLLWYVFNMLRLNSLIFESVRLIKERVYRFGEHLNKLHSMESYYGDATLQNMIEHSKELVDNLDEFLQSMEAGDDE